MSFFLVESDQYPYVYFGGGGKDPWYHIIKDGILDPQATFTRASKGTTEITPGVFALAEVNEPRFKWVNGKRGLLIEDASTNILYPSAVGSTQTRAVTAQAYTLSFKGTGTVALSGASTGSLVGTGVNNLVSLTFTPTAGNLTLTVTGSVNDWQLEAKTFPTSCVPTTSAAATRAADLCSIGTGVIGFDAGKGTFVCDFYTCSTRDTVGQVIINFGLNSNFYIGPDGAASFWNGSQGGSTENKIEVSSKVKSGICYSISSMNICALGGNVSSNVFGIGSLSNYLFFGSSNGSLFINGVLFDVKYQPKTQSDADLQGLTS